MAANHGVAASGSIETSQAAIELLRAGGNAFDAVLGAMCAATVAEPLLASLGGGGFLLALEDGKKPQVFDFFCQTPKLKRPASELDFYPIVADFGAAEQEFHIGMGSMAVPGVIAGLFDAHRSLGRMPIKDVVQPAVELARAGVEVNAFHHYIIRILRPILEANESVRSIYGSHSLPGHLVQEGERLRHPGIADALEQLVVEGPELMYRGDWARQLVADCIENGGQLRASDLADYRVIRREPAVFRYRGARCAINPPPSPGGCLVGLALLTMSDWDSRDTQWGKSEHLLNTLRGMRAASLARHDEQFELHRQADDADAILDQAFVRRWQAELNTDALFSRGTTHISTADADGNIASLTLSNGEGCAYILPGTGIMMNNMLGEEDLNPSGFHLWKPGVRMVSMMSPALLETAEGVRYALGSGGSNRIRSAISQVLINLLDFDMSPQQAVAASRMHLEGNKLSFEPGFCPSGVDALRLTAPECQAWPEKNLFFGGVNAVSVSPDGRFDGAGDPRRGGAVLFSAD